MTTTTTITQSKLSYEKPNILFVKLKTEGQLMAGTNVTPGGGAGGGDQEGFLDNGAKYFFEELFDYADANDYNRFVDDYDEDF